MYHLKIRFTIKIKNHFQKQDDLYEENFSMIEIISNFIIDYINKNNK